MLKEKTKLAGCVVVTPETVADERGYFIESFRQSWMDSLVEFSANFVQDNQSFSCYGTIRGLHFQEGEHAQSKLVRVVQGTILDVVLDLRQESPTCGEHISVELSDQNNHQLWIPKGFAHGFSVLSETAIVCYKCDAYYNKESEAGIYPLDSDLAIDWQLPKEKRRISEKDALLPTFSSIYK
ncbi:MAG: dTDP-4-dehydrorhamnose 3,5-epimerase [Flavobacteriaceae bacterium]|nr:dTDP-4-dehydrorhamnose 3,5-epimerase [Flavobacteriaceae bacterium]|tara:strand:+ start:2119 stop:2664 length:546 start_codon:yes stop_codon:yes gene_type:complete